jgi:hypothetical protein
MFTRVILSNFTKGFFALLFCLGILYGILLKYVNHCSGLENFLLVFDEVKIDQDYFLKNFVG